MSMIEIKEASVTSKEAIELMEELSKELEAITGCSGSAGFHSEKLEDPRTVFLIAYDDGIPAGCGALLRYDQDTAELKRVYTRVKGAGIGSQIVRALEQSAVRFGYQKIQLATRKINLRAVRFYESHGYEVCEHYGNYIGRSETVCFLKNIWQEK